MRPDEEVSRAIEQYADTVRRICFLHLKNHADTEDIFQTVFLKYALFTDPFEDERHEKAWLILVTINACNDLLRRLLRHPSVPLELLAEEAASVSPEQNTVLSAVLSLPKKYKDAIYLHYYEGYTAAEIAAILHTRENTVYSLLSRGRAMLKEELGGEDV